MSHFHTSTKVAHLANSSNDASSAGADILDVAMEESDGQGMRLLACARFEDSRHDVVQWCSVRHG